MFRKVPSFAVDNNSFGDNVTITMLSWGEPFNNLDPIVNYTGSCSPNFTTTDNTTRNYTIANLTLMTNYTFSVVATNSVGSGKAGVVMITTPPGEVIDMYFCVIKCHVHVAEHAVHTYVRVYVTKFVVYVHTFCLKYGVHTYIYIGFIIIPSSSFSLWTSTNLYIPAAINRINYHSDIHTYVKDLIKSECG